MCNLAEGRLATEEPNCLRERVTVWRGLIGSPHDSSIRHRTYIGGSAIAGAIVATVLPSLVFRAVFCAPITYLAYRGLRSKRFIAVAPAHQLYGVIVRAKRICCPTDRPSPPSRRRRARSRTGHGDLALASRSGRGWLGCGSGFGQEIAQPPLILLRQT